MMTPRLPSTQCLRGLEAAARLQSFTAAARELNLTQGAISRQIRELEELLGVELFRRSTRQIEMTPAGADYVSAIRPLLQKLAAATSDVKRRRSDQTLTISVLPTLASMWLMPRLNGFLQSHPGFDLRVMSSIEPAQNLEKAGAVALRVGTLPGQKHKARHPRISLQMVANWDGIDVDPLFPDTLVPVCARALIKGAVPTSASEIARYPLIHTSTRIDAWGDWLSAQGVQMGRRSELIFGHFFMALEAARRTLGIALVPSILLQDLQRDGDLLILPSAQIPSAGFYYLLTHEDNRGDPAIGCFRTWIHREASTIPDSPNLEPALSHQE